MCLTVPVCVIKLCKNDSFFKKNQPLLLLIYLLFRFDKTVKEFREMEKHEVAFEYMKEWNDCVVEMRGQLYLNAAVYAMKLAQDVHVLVYLFLFLLFLFLWWKAGLHYIIFC